MAFLKLKCLYALCASSVWLIVSIGGYLHICFALKARNCRVVSKVIDGIHTSRGVKPILLVPEASYRTAVSSARAVPFIIHLPLKKKKKIILTSNSELWLQTQNNNFRRWTAPRATVARLAGMQRSA